MTSDDPGPGQQYALEARRHVTALRAKDPNIQIETRWCPSHQGIEGNETAVEWSKLAADAHGVEWLSTTDPDGKITKRDFPLPRSLAVKRGFSEQKWADSKNWTGGNLPGLATGGGFQKPDPTVAKARKRLAARFYQLKTGHCQTGQHLASQRPDASYWWRQYRTQTRDHLFKHCPEWKNQQKTL